MQIHQLKEDDNNSVITVDKSDLITITLQSKPSSGFLWQQANTSAGVLEEIKYGPPKNIPGEIIDVRFIFSINKEGMLVLDYARPWDEQTPILKWFEVNVKLR